MSVETPPQVQAQQGLTVGSLYTPASDQVQRLVQASLHEEQEASFHQDVLHRVAARFAVECQGPRPLLVSRGSGIFRIATKVEETPPSPSHEELRFASERLAAAMAELGSDCDPVVAEEATLISRTAGRRGRRSGASAVSLREAVRGIRGVVSSENLIAALGGPEEVQGLENDITHRWSMMVERRRGFERRTLAVEHDGGAVERVRAHLQTCSLASSRTGTPEGDAPSSTKSTSSDGSGKYNSLST